MKAQTDPHSEARAGASHKIYLQKDGPSAMPCAPGQAGSMQCLT